MQPLSLNQPVENEHERWILSQKLCLAAQLVRFLSLTDAFHSKEFLLGVLMSPPGGRRLNSFLMTLPVSTLHVLAGCIADEGGDFEPFAEAVGTALSRLTGTDQDGHRGGPTRASHIDRVHVWAAHAMLGHGQSRRLLRMGARNDFFGVNWKLPLNYAQAEKTLDHILPVLRTLDHKSDTLTRTRGITRLATALSAPDAKFISWRMAQVENVMMHHQFAWPLLLIEDLPFAFPVGVDFFIDEDRFIKEDGSGGSSSEVEGMEGALDLSAWRDQLERCARSAKTIWRSKHGNVGDFRRLVQHHGVIRFDFSFAQRIADVADLKPFLADHSADAYFAQAALSRILGMSVFQPGIAIGGIGEESINPQGERELNFTLDEPEGRHGLEQKLRFAATHGGYGLVVIPEEARRKLDPAVPEGLTVRTASHLQGMADHMQLSAWRQYRYIRCPRVQWATHTNRGGTREITRNNPPDQAPVKEVLDALRTNRYDAVASVKTSAEAVASALWHINTVHRLGDPAQHHRHIDPSLSWAFIRVLKNESDEQLWHHVLGACGLRPHEIDDEFKRDREDFHTHLKNLLNSASMTESDRNRRAPDVLVIVGAEHLAANGQSMTPSSRALLAQPALLALRDGLHSVTQSSLKPHLGATRVILVDESGQPSPRGGTGNFGLLDRLDALLLRVLSTFRFGFTLEQAKFLFERHPAFGRFRPLKPDDLSIEYRLNRLANVGRLGYIDGQYHLSPAAEAEAFAQSVNEYHTATDHYIAAWALAPYVRSDDDLPLGPEAIFDPEARWEAEWHLQSAHESAARALQAARKTGGNQRSVQGLQRAVWHARQMLFTFSEIPTWLTVRRHLTAKSPAHAATLADDLLYADDHLVKQNHLRNAHPIQLSTAAEAHVLAAAAQSDHQRALSADRAAALYQAATDGLAEMNVTPEERSATEIMVRSWYGSIHGYEDHDEVLSQARAATEAAEYLDPDVLPHVRAHTLLFSKGGDIETSDSEAYRLYSAGALIRPNFFHNVVKAIGTAHPDDVPRLVQDAEAYRNPRKQNDDIRKSLERVRHHLTEAERLGPRSPLWNRWLSDASIESIVRTTDRVAQGFDRISSHAALPRISRLASRAADETCALAAAVIERAREAVAQES